jgi:hypothetical protein
MPAALNWRQNLSMTCGIAIFAAAGTRDGANGGADIGPLDWRPSTSLPLAVERFLGVALVSAAFVLGYPRHWFWVVSAVILTVTLLEAFQLLVPLRHASLIDWAVKVVGALVGTGAGKIARI